MILTEKEIETVEFWSNGEGIRTNTLNHIFIIFSCFSFERESQCEYNFFKDTLEEPQGTAINSRFHSK